MVMAKGHSFNKIYFLSTSLPISMVVGAEDTAVNKIQKSFYGAYILMRGGRQETNAYFKNRHGVEQSISESCYIRKVVRLDANRNLGSSEKVFVVLLKG